MSRLTRDPELDQLVRSINQSPAGEAPAATLPPWPAADVAAGSPLEPLLLDMARRGASDLLIMADAAAIFREGGRIVEGDGAPFEIGRAHV